MSKSLNNFYTLDNILKHVSDPIAFRLLILQSNYQNRSDFSYDNLAAAHRRLISYQNFSALQYQFDNENKSSKFDFKKIQELIEQAMLDDLNSTKALAELSVFINSVENNKINQNQSEDFINFIKFIDDIFGFNLADTKDITSEQNSLVARRLTERNNQNWSESDSIRGKLVSEGIGVNDIGSTQVWFRL